MANDKAFKVKNDLDVGGDVTVAGNLTVEGSTITLDNATVQTFTWGDNDKAVFGDGSDLQIYHDGTTSKIDGNVSFTNNVTLSGGTANGVAYLNGSKVLTSGSALTFDGTNLGVGTNSPSTYGKFVVNTASSNGVIIGDLATPANDTSVYLRTNGVAAIATGSGGSIKFTQGGPSGSELMRLTSTGLGIGTANPAGRLQTTGSGDQEIRFTHSDNVSGRLVTLRLTNSNGGYYQYGPYLQSIQGAGLNAYSGLAFGINNSERMRLTSTGLGIGTSSPTNKLTVDGNANITGNTTLGDASTDTVTVNGYMGVGVAPNASLGIYVRSASLTGSNQHGIVTQPLGTSAATAQINGITSGANTSASAFTVADLAQFRAQGNTKGAGSTITNLHGVYIEDQTQGTNNYGITSLVSSGTNKWNIYASGTAANYFAGNVFLGNRLTTTSPSSAECFLSVSSTTGSELILKNSSGIVNGEFVGGVAFGHDDPTTAGEPHYAGIQARSIDTSGTMTLGFYTGLANYEANTPQVLIDSSGNVGIGTSSPSHKLDVSGGDIRLQNSSGTATMRIYGNDATAHTSSGISGGAVLQLKNTNTGANVYSQINALDASSSTIGQITFVSVSDATNESYMAFAARPSGGNLTERARIDSSGHLIVPNGVTLGTAVGTYNAANTLDDYETGTFTPKIVGLTTAGTGTYTTQIGRYTKIGNRVYFSIRVDWSAHTGTGSMVIDGLPFATGVSANLQSHSVGWINGLTLPASSVLCAYNTSASVDYISLGTYASGGGSLTALAMDTAAGIAVSGQYETDA